MANKGPIKANRNTSHFTAVLIVHFIWLTCSVHHSLWGLCRFAYHVLLLAWPTCALHQSVREIFFFIDRVHLGVPNSKRVMKYITIRVISESSECGWRHQRHGKTQKNSKSERKSEKARHYVHWEIFWKTSTQGSTAFSNWSPLWQNFWRTFSAKCAPEMTCQLPWSLHIYLRPPFASHWKNSLTLALSTTLPHTLIVKYQMRWNSRFETCLLCLFHRQ